MKLSELTERQCAFCGDTFMPNTPRQVFDTADCRYRHARQVAWEAKQAEQLAAVEREAKAVPGLAKLLPPAQ